MESNRCELPGYGDKIWPVEVVQNLWDKAAKFMADQPQPAVEVGRGEESEGKTILFMRHQRVEVDPRYWKRERTG
jgi:hypothetical protein